MKVKIKIKIMKSSLLTGFRGKKYRFEGILIWGGEDRARPLLRRLLSRLGFTIKGG